MRSIPLNKTELIYGMLASRCSKGMDWQRQAAAILLVLALLCCAFLIVYFTGGTGFAYAHVTYVPIIVAAALFGFPGGLLAGILAGIVMGPFMPLDVETARAQNSVNWLIRTGFFTSIGVLVGLVFTVQARHLQIIRQHGFYNPVTGLPNRARCLQILDERLDAETRRSSILLLSVSIGRFEEITSGFGYQPSDILQKQAAERMIRLLPDDVRLFHVSSGVFSLILTTSPEEAASLGAVLLSALDEPFLIEGVPIWTGGHTGLAQQGLHGKDSMALLRASRSALREAEAGNRDVVIYNDGQDTTRRAALCLLPDLQSAIRTSEQITLHYQPKVDLRTGVCAGAEALVRWCHPERGMVPPGEFIPLVEQTALIEPLTELVLNLALKQMVKWQQEGIELTLAVNISVRNLENEQFPEIVAELLQGYGVDPSCLELEVTESGLMTSPGLVTTALLTLQQLGISIALDDFGTGQSSLSYLRDMPADTLKLDRSFIRDLAADPKNGFIVGSTIATAHKLGFQVVAEGVEDAEVWDMLRGLSCDYAQGHFISKPLAEPDFTKWLLDGGPVMAGALTLEQRRRSA